MGQGALVRAGSLGTGMYLFLGSFLAAVAAANALTDAIPIPAPSTHSSLLSLDLIHSFNLVSFNHQLAQYQH